jgi:hypothetical protein
MTFCNLNKISHANGCARSFVIRTVFDQDAAVSNRNNRVLMEMMERNGGA